MAHKADNLKLLLARVEDKTLGAAAYLPDSPTLNRLMACVGTAGGKDKVFAILQYTLKIVAQFLAWRAQLQHRAGRRAAPTSATAPALTKFAGIISDARMAFNFTGILAMLSYLKRIEAQPYKTRRLRTIERLQGWSILLYYPLEHLAYLIGHGVVPAEWTISRPAASQLIGEKVQSRSFKVPVGKIVQASMGLWGLYTALQLVHYWDDIKDLAAEAANLSKTKVGPTKQKLAEINRKRTLILGETIAQLCNLPLALHWGTGSTLIKSEFIVNLLNLISNLTSFRSVWISNGPPPSVEDAVTDPDILAPVGLDAGLDEI